MSIPTATQSINPSSPRSASSATVAANRAWVSRLPFSDTRDFDNARRGFLGSLDEPIRQEDGTVVWDPARYAFLDGEAAPDSVHPSLWRHAKLNLEHGLFKVTDGVYQVRGFDISNVTFIEGETGYVVIDPLTTAEPAAAALALMRQHRGDKPVTAVIYTHSHVDHYGGVMGVLSEADIAAGASVPGVTWNTASTPSMESRVPVFETLSVGATRAGWPSETALPSPASTWPRGPRGSRAPYM